MQRIGSMLNKLRYAFEKAWDEETYWRRRNYIQINKNRGGVLFNIYLVLLRRAEAKKNCTTGLAKNGVMCIISSPLILPHGLSGIVIAPNVEIGNNVTIYQHVTIARDDIEKKTVIEDDVVIGVGAVIMKNVHIGKGAKIGANAVVVTDVPAYATAVGVPAKIIRR